MNDKITAGVQEVGFCCPYAYLCQKKSKHDTGKRLAKETGVSVKAIEFNRKKLREGKLQCLKLSICKHPNPQETK